MPHDIVWIWSKDRVDDLARTYAGSVEGSKDAPMLYVSMSPGALLRLMRSMDIRSVAAMVRMPGEAEPTERTLNPWVVTAEDVVLQPGMVPTIEPPTEKQIREAQYKAKVEHGPKCSQCGQNWDEWACGPTHAMLRDQMGIEPKDRTIAAEDFFAEPDPVTMLYKPIDLGPQEITSEPVLPPANLSLMSTGHARPDPSTWVERPTTIVPHG